MSDRTYLDPRIAGHLRKTLCILLASAASAQATSTPEERTRWAEVSHKLESNPLDESVNKDREWAFNRLGEVHDIHVPLCRALGECNDPKYQYRHPITRQPMLASGALLIVNLDKAGDVAAMNVASVGSVPKVHSAILQQRPAAKSKPLDDLLRKQRQGKLDEALGKQCK